MNRKASFKEVSILGELAAGQFYCYVQHRKDGSPFYVGKGSNGRYSSYHGNDHYNSIIEKDGKENITTYIFPCSSEHEAFVWEVELICMLRSCGNKLCNFSDGGRGGCSSDPEVARKISIAKTGKKQTEQHIKNRMVNSYGRKRSEQTIFKIRESKKGHMPSKSTRVAAAAAKFGKPGTFLGKRHKQESILKNKEAHLRLNELRRMLGIPDPCKGRKKTPEEIEKWKISRQANKMNRAKNDNCK